MKKTNVPLDIKLTEGQKLADCLRAYGVQNETQFAREHGISKSGALVYQHRKGITAISMEAALAYSKGLGVPVSEFSTRLARQQEAIINSSLQNKDKTQSESVKVITPIKSKRDRHVDHIVSMLNEMSEEGIQQVIGAVTVIHGQHRISSRQTHK